MTTTKSPDSRRRVITQRSRLILKEYLEALEKAHSVIATMSDRDFELVRQKLHKVCEGRYEANYVPYLSLTLSDMIEGIRKVNK